MQRILRKFGTSHSRQFGQFLQFGSTHCYHYHERVLGAGGVRNMSNTASENINIKGSEGSGGSSTVSSEEIKKFEKISSDWWNPAGDFKPLHSMNLLRVEFIRNGFMNNRQIESLDTEFPLKGLTILDIGCGGGILSQPLARLGAKVTGLDAGKETVNIAKSSLPRDLKDNVKFICSTVEEFAAQNPGILFDGVVASEVIEHVQDTKLFLQVAAQCIKPSGSIFVTTINRTHLSWLAAIVAAEYVFRLLPTGTHEWNKFRTPEEIQSELNKNGCRTRLIHGMDYSVICNKWSWTRFTAINYALHAVKDP